MTPVNQASPVGKAGKAGASVSQATPAGSVPRSRPGAPEALDAAVSDAARQPGTPAASDAAVSDAARQPGTPAASDAAVPDAARQPGTPAALAPARAATQCGRPRRWGTALLGGETPVLAVATTAPTLSGCLDQALAAARAGAGVVELRADLLQDVMGSGPQGTDPRSLAQVLAEVGDAVGRALEEQAAPRARPGLLMTLRTHGEGGAAHLDDPGYRATLEALLRIYLDPGPGLHRPDALDVEVRRTGLAGLTDLAHRAGLDVVASHHDLSGTPTVEALEDLLTGMEADGADVVKVAVTPHGAVDVARLLTLTARARRLLDVPLVTMSMGEVGAVTRVVGGVFGSALTFVLVPGADGVLRPSAPGQLPLEQVRAVHEVLGLTDA